MKNDASDLTRDNKFSKWDRMLLALLVAFFLGSRLFSLLKMPVFIDEAIHIWWAREIHGGTIAAGFLEGKWLSIVLMSLSLVAPGDDLWLVRFTAVLAGLLTVVAIILTGRSLFSMRVALFATLLYLVFPFALFYNRLALADGIVAAFGAWVLYISIKTVRLTRGGYSVILALLLMLSMLAKFAGVLFFVIPPLAVLMLFPRNRWKTGIQRILPAMLSGFVTFLAVFLVGIPIHQITPKAQAGGIGSLFPAIVRNIKTLGN